MSSEMNDRILQIFCVLAVVVALLNCAGSLEAQALPTGDSASVAEGPEADVMDADTRPDEALQHKERRDALRKVALASLVIILLLIIFIVVVMIGSRRMRTRYLGWHRKIRFGKIWDVWWGKSEEQKPGGKKKPRGK